VLDFRELPTPTFADAPIDADPKRNGRARMDRASDHSDGVRAFKPRILSRCMSDVPATDVGWLWPNKIPRSRLTLLVGDGGLGKSFVTLAIASTVSTGAHWPDGENNDAAQTVVLLNAEDDPSDTIRRRLDNMGAACSRIHTIDGVLRSESGDPGYFSLVDDLRPLERLIVQHDAALCVVDPIGAYLPNVDTHKDGSVRAVLGPLAAMAEQTACAVIAVAHLNKGGGSNSPAARVSGSLAFTNAARMCWLVARDADNDSTRLLLPYKTNIVERAEGIAFVIEDNAVQWLTDRVEVTAESVLTESTENRTERDEAIAFLEQLLAHGPVSVAEVRRASEADGHSWRTVTRAKKSLHVNSAGEGYGKSGRFVWALETVAHNG